MIWFALLSCSDKEVSTVTEEQIIEDQDGDGYFEDDCDDANPTIHPGSSELCDGVDNNCDGSIDEDVLITYYVDSDGDGFGNEEITVEACSASDGFVSNGGDCDDSDSQTHPGAEEICDGADNNCAGDIDEGIGTIFYIDEDEDGFGSAEIEACMLRDGISSVSGDCDDQNSFVSPLAPEECDGIDNDCDGILDNGVLLLLFEDFDADGFGNMDSPVELCTQMEGYVFNSEDCDDSDSQSFPNADEICDGSDNDCNGLIDDNVLDLPLWYIDSDGDGYGDPLLSIEECDAPAIFYVSNGDDCNDAQATISPLEDERCDGVDNNCDGIIDGGDSIDQRNFYLDSDGDGFGDVLQTTQACFLPLGYAQDSTDCNDNDQDAYPGASEYCNSKDDDCDGQIDNDAINVLIWYLDEDSDGYGTSSMESCTEPVGYSSENGDCDDGNDLVSPSADEACDGVDNNCDGQIDEGVASDFQLFYLDSDEDGFGDIDSSEIACVAPEGYVDVAGDCDDSDSDIPINDVDCDGVLIDQDCNDGDASIGYCGSCQDILDAGQSTGDGLYNIYLDGWGDIEVYCDMTNFDGGWMLAGHQNPSQTFTDTTSDIGMLSFDPIQTFRWGNAKIQLIEPTIAWRITSDLGGVLVDNAWFRPECVIDWSVYVGIHGQSTSLDSDCGIAYTDETFTQNLGNYTNGNCSLGIGQNNSGQYCSIRMGSCPFGGVTQGGASPCSIQNVGTHDVKLWVK